MRQLVLNVWNWLDSRLHLKQLWDTTAGHPIPKSSASWFYVFGSATLLCFVIQVVTGILLAFLYAPSGDEAYQTLQYMTHEQPLGWFLRALHYWGSNFMVAIMVLHMTQVFLWGAYKFPRELTWISGCVLLLLTLGMAFTGQVLRFDADSYWGLGIGAAILGRVPLIGQQLVGLLLGGPIIAGETLARFFSLHVFVIPGLIIALLSMHLRLVLTKGINEYPKPGVQVRRDTYQKEYHELTHKEGIPFAPDGIGKDVVAAGVVLLLMVIFSAVYGPKGPASPPDPTQQIAEAKPDFWFLWIFALLALIPDYAEYLFILVLPAVVIVLLFALPFISNVGEKHWRRRPVAILTVFATYLGLGALTYFGEKVPWSPHMESWTSQPVKPEFIKGRTAVELQGQLVFQNKQCRNCHAIGGEGGSRGPDLTTVGTRMTGPQLVRQVIQGGGNMPAYGKNLSPHEVDALIAYLVSLRPKGVSPAQDAAQPVRGGGGA
jgi:ubiquinol-cytochrome c reductase cytochrome b subunit